MINANYKKEDFNRACIKANNLTNLLLNISNGAFINSRFNEIFEDAQSKEEMFIKMWDWFSEYYSLIASSIEAAYLISDDISVFLNDYVDDLNCTDSYKGSKG